MGLLCLLLLFDSVALRRFGGGSRSGSSWFSRSRSSSPSVSRSSSWSGSRSTSYNRMMYMRNPGMYGDWDDNYYRSYYLTNTCLFGCPMNSHCEWGFCECNAGTVRKYGQCRDNWSAQSMQARPSNFDPFKSCTESSDCMTTDMNLICNKNLTIQGTTGKCECRRDMKWNQQQGECSLLKL